MDKNIPKYDPQSGELNPFYEELTGKPNPLNKSIVNPKLYAKIMNKDFKYDSEIKTYDSYVKRTKRNLLEDNRLRSDVKHMPNQKWHKIISFIKSGVRIIGYGFIPFNLTIACVVLIFSEVIGVIEEMV